MAPSSDLSCNIAASVSCDTCDFTQDTSAAHPAYVHILVQDTYATGPIQLNVSIAVVKTCMRAFPAVARH